VTDNATGDLAPACGVVKIGTLALGTWQVKETATNNPDYTLDNTTKSASLTLESRDGTIAPPRRFREHVPVRE
jgi:hypothetical protein